MKTKGYGFHARAQVTLFVIIALVIVGALAMFFFFTSRISPTLTTYASRENPVQFISGCVEETTEDVIDLMMKQGGYRDPTLFTYQGTAKVAYLCYTSEDNRRCTNQEPLYLEHLQQEIQAYLALEVDRCFAELEKEFASRNIATETSNNADIEVRILPGTVKVDITRDFSFSDKGSAHTFSTFPSYFASSLYGMVFTIERIVSHEAQFCFFDYQDYMSFYPEFRIEKRTMSDGTVIYHIMDTLTSLEGRIGIRGCVYGL